MRLQLVAGVVLGHLGVQRLLCIYMFYVAFLCRETDWSWLRGSAVAKGGMLAAVAALCCSVLLK
jgi:pyruvate dehydrogenase complex dehydrogenase (E1) component